jgi:hypothetical protein
MCTSQTDRLTESSCPIYFPLAPEHCSFLLSAHVVVCLESTQSLGVPIIVLTTVRRGILGVHPDLAGSLAVSGDLTSESNKEQSSAGLLDMTKEQREEICSLNGR